MSDGQDRGFGGPRPDGPRPEGGGGEGRSRFGAGAQGGRPGSGPGGAGGPGGPGGPGRDRARRGGGRYMPRRKVCGFCLDNVGEVDYKDIARIRRHISERGKIEPRRKLGTCAKHQRSLTTAIKRARHVALLPFTTSVR
jgi:small subunit ribosomal protein S18